MNHCLCSECKIKNCDKKKKLTKVIQGKRNRNTGRYAELKLKKLFDKWNIKIEQTISSGSLKSVVGKVKEKYKFKSDFYTSDLVKGKRLRIENKKRMYKEFKRYYELTDNQICIIGDKYILISQNIFEQILIKNNNNHCEITVEDKKFKGLDNYFNQDNADIVTLISPSETGRYLDFIFCLKTKVYLELLKSKEIDK